MVQYCGYSGEYVASAVLPQKQWLIGFAVKIRVGVMRRLFLVSGDAPK
jgi:hypothetical protein